MTTFLLLFSLFTEYIIPISAAHSLSIFSVRYTIVSKKVKFFRYFVANFAIAAVAAGLLMFTLTGKTVSTAGEAPPVYKGESKTKVSLMVNVYWGTEYLNDMLDIFERNNVKTTFFVGGMWVAENDALLKTIYEKGHEIGNHGYFHKDHKKLSAERNAEEINVTHRLVKSVLGIDMKLFAPPSGSFGKTTLQQAEALGYTTIMWTHDTIDWRDHDTEKIFKRATQKLEGGDLILMHPTKNTVEALDRIIRYAKEHNLQVSPVSEVLAADPGVAET